MFIGGVGGMVLFVVFIAAMGRSYSPGGQHTTKLVSLSFTGGMGKNKSSQVISSRPVQELNSSISQPFESCRRPPNENLVSIDSKFKTGLWMLPDRLGEAGRLGVGVTRQIQPQAVLDVGQ